MPGLLAGRCQPTWEELEEVAAVRAAAVPQLQLVIRTQVAHAVAEGVCVCGGGGGGGADRAQQAGQQAGEG
jgi:hypothetical protein